MARRKWMLLVRVAFLATPVSVFANGMGSTVWDLIGFNPGGSISWNGTSAGALIGSGIAADFVDGNSTPSNAGASHDLTISGNSGITNGALSFNTGGNSYNGTMGSSWSWGTGTGATLRLTGCITGPGITLGGNCDNNVLLEDSFQNVAITPIGGGYNLIFGGIQGTINPAVANYFGLGNNTGFASASFNFTIQSSSNPGNAFTSTVANPGVINANATVAEDWNALFTVGFFAVALATFGAARRFRLLIRPVVA